MEKGPTLTMSQSFDNPTFPRSHSSPNIPDLAKKVEHKRPPTKKADELPRSASFSALPILGEDYKFGEDLARVASVNVPLQDLPDGQQKADGEGQTLLKEERPNLERIGRRKSLIRPKSWITRAKGSPEQRILQDSGRHTTNEIPPVSTISKETGDSKTKTVTESFATFARKSWISTSRSPSPSRRIRKELDKDGRAVGESKMTGSLVSSNLSTTTTKTDKPNFTDPFQGSSRSTRTGSTQKVKQRSTSILMSFTTFNSANSSRSSLPRSSLDNTSTPRTSTDKVPPLPKTLSNEKQVTPEPPRKRDALWSAFRSLENDFSKFQAKSWSLKTNVVRSSLLPFLRTNADHPSNKSLRHEDLDRRVTILNKWWTGLLEVLDGRQNQTVSGVDRPVLLEACYAIMTRPEWRQAPATTPLAEKSPNRTPERRSSLMPRKRDSTFSVNSAASQFLIESVYHNTRNLFIQNLTSQMSFVVDKMSLRHAPASLVTFCGKATAYAFFFVPGIAEILVRIWKLHADVLRRVSDELGMPRKPNKVDTDEIIMQFPEHIRCLGWSSVKGVTNLLRKPPLVPVVSVKIQWHGPWVSRWCGRDSDLFFVFVKHYHILAEEFFSVDAQLCLVEKARAPGFAIIQAQILCALDATIHRQPASESLPITFDDVLAGADANATVLPLPSNNSTRQMAENRLIMLLRDFISERPSDYENARLTFGESFAKVMQAGARRTSLFDHNACFVLCDFMEEALTIFVRFHHAHALEHDLIDWRFWMDVCKKILESENSMSEIRLFAFLYGSWNVINRDEKRKEVICLEWLTTKETFDKFFNHWCPMVRAYYMRLLVWRLCRDDGEVTELDIKIFNSVSVRIKTNYAYYLHLKAAAEESNSLPPSIAPCHPAPGRRLLIIRNDNQSPASNLFLGFDGIVTTASSQALGTTQPTAYRKTTSLNALNKADIKDPKLTTDLSPPASIKKGWRTSLMGKVSSTFSSSSGSSTQAQPESPPRSSSPRSASTGSPTKSLEEARKETAAQRSARPSLASKSSSTESTDTLPHRAFAFKFSLEWHQHFTKPETKPESTKVDPGIFTKEPKTAPPKASRMLGLTNTSPRLASPRLPAPAQAVLSDKNPSTARLVYPRDPEIDGAEKGARYAGRALAEWAGVVGECNGFVERRRGEGVPSLRLVEVPGLGVEGFRRYGAGRE